MPIGPIPPPAEPRSAIWATRIGWAVLLLGLTQVLLVAARLFQFTFPVADDMCRAGAPRTIGVMPYLKDLYLHWSGRWSGVGLALVLGTMPSFSSAYPWVLGAVQLTLPIAVYALLSAMFADRLNRRTRVILSLGFLAIHWSGNPRLEDSYYWLTGALENHLPLSFGLLIMAGLIRAGRQTPSRWTIAALAALAAITPGLHELYGLFLGAALFVGTVLAYWAGSPGRKTWATVAAAGLVGLIINLAAPGNANRLGFNAPAHNPARFICLSRDWASVVYHWATDPKLLLATILIAFHPRAIATCPDWLSRRRETWAAAAVAATFGMLVSVIAINWWTTQDMLPGRTQSAIYFLFLAGWFLTAFALAGTQGLAARAGRPVWAALAVCFAAVLFQGDSFRLVNDDLKSGRAEVFHQQVKARDRALRAAVASGDRNPNIPPITNAPSCLVFADVDDHPEDRPLNTVNPHYCLYYGLDSIHLRRDAIASSAQRTGDDLGRK